MSGKKRQKIQEQLERVEKSLLNAAEYVENDVNVEGSSFLHFDDWLGKSGHPSWMKNVAMPVMMKYRARKERALESIDTKAKDKELTTRRRYRGTSGEEFNLG
jgi:hypothetical protein